MEFQCFLCFAEGKEYFTMQGRRFFSIFDVRSYVHSKTVRISKFHDCQFSYLCEFESEKQRTKSAAFFFIECLNATVSKLNFHVISNISPQNIIYWFQSKEIQLETLGEQHNIDTRFKNRTQKCYVCCLVQLDHTLQLLRQSCTTIIFYVPMAGVLKLDGGGGP